MQTLKFRVDYGSNEAAGVEGGCDIVTIGFKRGFPKCELLVVSLRIKDFLQELFDNDNHPFATEI